MYDRMRRMTFIRKMPTMVGPSMSCLRKVQGVVVVVKEEEEEEEKLRYRRLPSVSLVSPWTRSWMRNSHRFTRRDKAGQRRHSFSKVLYTVFLIVR